MIKTDAAYNVALQQLQRDSAAILEREERLRKQGRSDEHIARAMAPQYTLLEQLRDEIEWYEKARRGDVQEARSFTSVGRLLIALRIASGMSQRDLAQELGVDESMVSRDERNEYHGISITRADQIIRALRGRLQIKVKAKPHAQELIPA